MLGRLAPIAALVLCIHNPVRAETWVNRADVQAFITEMTQEHGFNRDRLTAVFAQVTPKPGILAVLDRPSTSQPYYRFRPRFVNEENTVAGTRFWQNHTELLSKISSHYQVEPEYLIAILGIETRWGKITGSFRVLDALSTIAFDYPRRAEYFRKELREFLLLAREEGKEPLNFKGSYAGAMGMPQFMPSSFHAYAQDWDGDQKRDLWNNTGDILASIANYFSRHGWQAGEPLTMEAQVTGEGWKTLAETNFKLQHRVSEMASYGASPTNPKDQENLSRHDPLAILAPLEPEPGITRYIFGLNNFYVITRYNRSTHYAMAVHELAESIRTRHDAATTSKKK